MQIIVIILAFLFIALLVTCMIPDVLWNMFLPNRSMLYYATCVGLASICSIAMVVIGVKHRNKGNI